MAKSASPRKHLKLYTEQPPKDVRPQIESVACLPDLCRAFQKTTGWSLQYVSAPSADVTTDFDWATPISVGPAFPPGILGLKRLDEKREPAKSKQTKLSNENQTQPKTCEPSWKSTHPKAASTRPFPLDRENARDLAGSIAELLGELMQTRSVVWQREAELAAGVPLAPHREEEKHLAARLESVLRAGVEAVGGDAAALYLLDDATTELKLRSSWGLPFDRLAAAARPLQGAVADLEALLGHAVVLNDERVIRVWNMPEDFPAAVCVPVSTPTMLLGTLWVFCNEKRDFSERETNTLEIIAGRIASDLEREMLLRASIDAAKLQKQMAAAERLQRNALPTISPLLDHWNVAGWTSQAEEIGGAFHDWFCLPRGLLAVAVGKAADQGIPGALTANALKTALRAHARYHRQAERILQQANLTLWTGSAGDQQASLFCGLVETATGRVCCSSAGKISAIQLTEGGWKSLSETSPRLGESVETDYQQFGRELMPGEVLVLFTPSLSEAVDAKNRPLGEAGVAKALLEKRHLSAEELVAAVRDAHAAHAVSPAAKDISILVVKRTTG